MWDLMPRKHNHLSTNKEVMFERKGGGKMKYKQIFRSKNTKFSLLEDVCWPLACESPALRQTAWQGK